MTITYLFRSPGTGHSIEGLFTNLASEINQQADISTKIIRVPHISRGWRSIWQNLRFVKRLTSDLFHVTGDIHYAALALPKLHTVLTIHDCSLLEKNRHRPLRYALFWTLWYYLPIRRAAVTTVVSEKTRQELIRYVGQLARSVQVIPNGYDPAFTFQPRPLRHHQPVLLQIGTAPNKNLARLLAAIDGITCQLIIVGSLTKSIIDDLKQRRIDYYNVINMSRLEMVHLYNNCDIVTFISTYEGFGMPVIEANAVGRAVITSAISPLYELASGAALFVNPTNPVSIRQGILKLIHDNDYRAQLITAGRRNADQYTQKKVAAQYMAVYKRLAFTHLPGHVL